MKYTVLLFYLITGTVIHSQESSPVLSISRLYRSEAAALVDESRYTDSQTFHFIRDQKTGKTSNDYLRIEMLGNFLIGSTETGIDVVDTNLRVITSLPLQGDSEIEMLDSRRFPFNYDWSYRSDNGFDYRESYDEPFVNRLFSVAVITYEDSPSKRQARKGADKTARKQLLHLPSGRTSYGNYLEVYRIISEQAVYYWALKDTSGQSQVFDVYNEQLECLRSVQITPPEKFHEFHTLSRYREYELDEYYSIPGKPQFYLENPEGKLAVLHHNGTRLTDFIWDRKVTYEGVKRDSTPVFLLCKDTSFYGILMDKNGEPLFGNEYASLYFAGGQKYFYFRKKHPEIKIVSADFEILLDSVEHFRYYDASFLNTNSQSSYIYIDKKNRLFIHTSDGISPLYPSFFKEPKTRNRVSRSVPLFVDEQGYLIPD